MTSNGRITTIHDWLIDHGNIRSQPITFERQYKYNATITRTDGIL